MQLQQSVSEHTPTQPHQVCVRVYRVSQQVLPPGEEVQAGHVQLLQAAVSWGLEEARMRGGFLLQRGSVSLHPQLLEETGLADAKLAANEAKRSTEMLT